MFYEKNVNLTFLYSLPKVISWSRHLSTKVKIMPWYVYLAHLLAGVFLANGVPHFVNGISGNIQTLFASPPAVGASPLINVFWGIVNFVVGVLLLTGIGKFELGINADTLAFVIGIVMISSVLAWHFRRVRNS